MEFVSALLKNKVLISGAAGWLCAQLLKIIIEVCKGGFSPERIAGAGGMPSTHSATVSALTTAALCVDGPASSTFAIALFVSFIVMYDGMSVRYVTGRQSAILNRMENSEKLPEKMGHTFPETVVGCIIGIAAALLICLVILPQ